MDDLITFRFVRSLIQIKSHGQKVMKRMKQGENVFGQMEEHCGKQIFEVSISGTIILTVVHHH